VRLAHPALASEFSKAQLRAAAMRSESALVPWNLAEIADLLDVSKLRPAAVLIGLIARESGWQVLLTQRTESMTNHGGQVSFPGGKIEPGDHSPIAAALRETEEECGIGSHLIQPWGYLQSYATISNYLVTPVLAELDASVDPVPQEAEVADIFEAPLALFTDANNRPTQSREYLGRLRTSYVFEHEGRKIWGATAAMLVHFADLLLVATPETMR
jgi:8-oxo-dGTP pyrophosphatase MutT (NUDIX family)